MKITNCKLSKKVQKKLLEFFVLEVTARSAANLLEINPNSAALFYRKIRQVIAYHLELQADEVFDGSVELEKAILVDNIKVNAVAVRLVKSLFLAF